MSSEREQTTTSRFRLSQESITVVTVGIALAGLILVAVSDLREQGRADRAAWQAESQELREAAQADRAAWQAESQRLSAAWQAESRQLRDENRAGREAFERRMEALQRQVVGLSIEQAKLAAAGQGE